MIQTALNLLKELMDVFAQPAKPTVVYMKPAPPLDELPDYVLDVNDVTAANQFLRGVRSADLNVDKLSDRLMSQPKAVADVAIAALLVGGLNLFVEGTKDPNYLTGLYRHFDESSDISWN